MTKRLRSAAFVAVVAAIAVSAVAAGGVAQEWVRLTRIENADLGCPARGGVFDPDALTCTRAAADGTVVDVPYSSTPSTFESVALVGGAVAFVVLVEGALLAGLRLVWRVIWRRPRTHASGAVA